MKTNLDKLFKTSRELEVEGRRFEIDDSTFFQIRRYFAGNPKIKESLTAHYKPYAKQVDMGTMLPEKMREIEIKVFVETCVITWEGILDENGQPIPFSQDNAIKLFTGLPDLFDKLKEYAEDFNNYKFDVGNS